MAATRPIPHRGAGPSNTHNTSKSYCTNALATHLGLKRCKVALLRVGSLLKLIH
jgi:hypothetical protein